MCTANIAAAIPHADLYLYLGQWSDMEAYLNVGYSHPGQYHLHVSSHVRLINRLADGLLDLHTATADRRLLDIAAGRGGAGLARLSPLRAGGGGGGHYTPTTPTAPPVMRVNKAAGRKCGLIWAMPYACPWPTSRLAWPGLSSPGSF